MIPQTHHYLLSSMNLMSVTTSTPTKSFVMRLVARIRALVHHVGCLLKDESSLISAVDISRNDTPPSGWPWLGAKQICEVEESGTFRPGLDFHFCFSPKIYLRARVFIDIGPLQHVEKTLHTVPSPTMEKCLHKKGHIRQHLLSPSGDLGIGLVWDNHPPLSRRFFSWVLKFSSNWT